MLIIVEGPDGAGKTTFIERLTAQLRSRTTHHSGIRVLHATPPRRHPLEEYERPLFGYLTGVHEHVICDRWHWGESVYPAVLGRSTQFDLAVRRHVELYLRSRGAVVAYLTTPASEVRRRLTVRGDDLIRPAQADDIYRRYEAVARRSMLPVVRVPAEYTPDDVARVIETAAYNERLVAKLEGFTTYVGSPHPDLLLLGDVRHELRKGHETSGSFDTRWPAFGPFPATSGHYLLSHMHTVRGVGVANACDVDDWRVLHERLGKPFIVTLGAEAHRQLGSFPHGAVPHPQFIRRFHHSAGAAYATLIENSEGDDQTKWRPTSGARAAETPTTASSERSSLRGTFRHLAERRFSTSVRR